MYIYIAIFVVDLVCMIVKYDFLIFKIQINLKESFAQYSNLKLAEIIKAIYLKNNENYKERKIDVFNSFKDEHKHIVIA